MAITPIQGAQGGGFGARTLEAPVTLKPASGVLMTTLKIEGLSRDIIKKRSHVTVVWKDDPKKQLGLPIPFDCQLDALRAETEKALRALIMELESATIEGP
jgi:hypothetical protein